MFECVLKTPLLPVKKKANSLIYYIILFNFINCPVFKNSTKTLRHKVAIE